MMAWNLIAFRWYRCLRWRQQDNQEISSLDVLVNCQLRKGVVWHPPARNRGKHVDTALLWVKKNIWGLGWVLEWVLWIHGHWRNHLFLFLKKMEGSVVDDWNSVSSCSRWGVSNMFLFSPQTWGNDQIWRAYFSDGWFNHQPSTIINQPTNLPKR